MTDVKLLEDAELWRELASVIQDMQLLIKQRHRNLSEFRELRAERRHKDMRKLFDQYNAINRASVTILARADRIKEEAISRGLVAK